MMSVYAQSMLRTLQRLRRRAFRVLAVSYTSSIGLYALLGLAVYYSVGVTRPALPLALFVPLLLILVLCVALVIAALSVPTRQELAQRIDRTYKLHQRLETSLEYLTHHDAFSLLLHEDACRVLARVDLVQLLPYRLSVGSKTLLLVVLTTGGLGIGLSSIVAPHGSPDLSALGPWRRSSGQPQVVRPGVTPTAVRLTQPHQQDMATAGEARMAGASLRTLPRLPAAHGRANPTITTSEAAPSPAVRPPGSQSRTTRRPANDQVRDSAAPGSGSAMAAGVQRPAPSQEQHTRTNAMARQAQHTASMQTVAQGPRGDGGEQQVTTYARRHTPDGTITGKAGLATAPPLLMPESDRHAPLPLPRRHRPSPRYGDTGEAVLANTQIPPGLRAYIRDYFVAIRSPAQAHRPRVPSSMLSPQSAPAGEEAWRP